MGASVKTTNRLLSRLLAVLLLSMFCSYVLPIQGVAQSNSEICDNGIDDDGDGQVDLNDNDCVCEVIAPVSAIPNPSFEDMNCCPSNRSQLDCADVWIQASEPTTDYLHQCGWNGWENFPPPMPYPDGEAIMGFRDGRNFQGGAENNWKEYAGACLISPLRASETYRFEFFLGFVDNQKSPLIDITFFGTTDCENLPFGVGREDLGCPTNGSNWVRLGSRRVSSPGGSSWVKTTIDVVPREDIRAIAIGPSCQPTTAFESTYYFFDNLVLDDIRAFEFVISEVNHPCAEDFALAVPEEEGLAYQWYKEGVALVGETEAQLSQIYGEGQYQVRTMASNGSCSITQEYNYLIPSFNTSEPISICEGDIYNFGTQQITTSGQYVETFKNANNCDSTVVIDLDVLLQDGGEIDVKIFEGEEYGIGSQEFKTEGTHVAQLTSALGCDSLVDVNLEFYNIYMPNIFSPTSINGNDRFMILGNDDLVEVSSLIIYNRWGQQVYAETNLLGKESDGWNGRKDDEDIQPGVYLYRAQVLMDDGKERLFTGELMVLY